MGVRGQSSHCFPAYPERRYFRVCFVFAALRVTELLAERQRLREEFDQRVEAFSQRASTQHRGSEEDQAEPSLNGEQVSPPDLEDRGGAGQDVQQSVDTMLCVGEEDCGGSPDYSSSVAASPGVAEVDSVDRTCSDPVQRHQQLQFPPLHVGAPGHRPTRDGAKREVYGRTTTTTPGVGHGRGRHQGLGFFHAGHTDPARVIRKRLMNAGDVEENPGPVCKACGQAFRPGWSR